MYNEPEKTPLTAYDPEIEHMSKNWVWYLVLGIVLIILGILAFVLPISTSFAVTYILGLILLVGGLVQGVTTLFGKMGGFWRFVGAVLYVIVGYLLLTNATVSTITIALLLAVLFLVVGVVRVFASYDMMPETGRGWVLFSGIVAMLLGLIILGLPAVSMLSIIGLLVAIDLIVLGVVTVVKSLKSRHFTRPAESMA